MTRIGLFIAGLFSIQAAATTQGTVCIESDFSLSPPAAEIARDLSSTDFPTATFNEKLPFSVKLWRKICQPSDGSTRPNLGAPETATEADVRTVLQNQGSYNIKRPQVFKNGSRQTIQSSPEAKKPAAQKILSTRYR